MLLVRVVMVMKWVLLARIVLLVMETGHGSHIGWTAAAVDWRSAAAVVLMDEVGGHWR